MQDKCDKNLAPIKRRIYNYLKDNGISQSDFFKKVGVSASTLRGSAAKSEFKGDTIAKFLSEYRDASIRWIMLGEEEEKQIPQTTHTSSGLPQDCAPNNNESEAILYLSKALSQAHETISRLQEELERLRLLEGLDALPVDFDKTADAHVG